MLIDKLKEKAKLNKKRIILPESNDKRILVAAEKLLKEDICDIILIGNLDDIKNSEYELLKANIIDPVINKELTSHLASLLVKIRNMDYNEAFNLINNDYMYYATLMLYDDLADGIVSGSCHKTSDTLRPALQIIKCKDNVNKASSFVLLEKDEKIYMTSDSGLNQDPTEEDLVDIAYLSSKNYEFLIGNKSYVGMISHSTNNSASHDMVTKMQNATKMCKEKYPSLLIDGEMQIDAALNKDVAKIKMPNSIVAGNVNTLIFSNLDAGNSAYKLFEYIGGYKAYGPIIQGLRKPVNDLSRGSSIDDIIGTIIITIIEAQNSDN